MSQDDIPGVMGHQGVQGGASQGGLADEQVIENVNQNLNHIELPYICKWKCRWRQNHILGVVQLQIHLKYIELPKCNCRWNIVVTADER